MRVGSSDWLGWVPLADMAQWFASTDSLAVNAANFIIATFKPAARLQRIATQIFLGAILESPPTRAAEAFFSTPRIPENVLEIVLAIAMRRKAQRHR